MNHSNSAASQPAASTPFPQQLLEIGAGMKRASSCFGPGDGSERRAAYQHCIELVDAAIATNQRFLLRRELQLSREMLADLSTRREPDAATHELALRLLLALDPECAGEARRSGI